MTKVGTLAKVTCELLKTVPKEAGATLSRGQAETLAGLAEIAAAVLAEARQADKERAAVLADAGRAEASPVMIQDLEMLCDIMTDPENDIDVVNDSGAAYEYDVIATLYQQARAAGYKDGQAIQLQPAGQTEAIEKALCCIENAETQADGKPQTAAELQQTIDKVYSILQAEA